MSDFEHWIWWLHSLFAFLAEIKVISDGTLVSYSQNRISVASVADNLGVNNFGLLLSFLLEVTGQQLLILLSAVSFNLVVQNFLEILEELVVDLPCSIALLAWKTIFVDHFAIAFEALWKIIEVFGTLLTDHIFWPQDKTTDHLFISDVVFLTGDGFSDDLGIAHCILGNSLTLRGTFVSIDHNSNIFVEGVGAIGIAAKTVLDFLVAKFFHHVSGIGGLSGTVDIILTTSN